MSEVASRSDDRMRRTVASAVWAAWADALGFVTELTDEAGLRRRLRGRTLNAPPEWTRRVGGRFGVDVTLPAGCYSDDTQLRLATSRAIGMHGFDVEAFARVELAVWPTYALGGGRATKAAASNLARPNTAWFSNTFDGWVEAGGNGVAMRVQPHVWASPTPAALGRHLLDVLVNGVTTHGHPRALVGAVFHAVTLGATLQTGEVPHVDHWESLLRLTGEAVDLLDGDPNLAALWRPTWEKTTGRSFAQCWQNTVDECRDSLAAAFDAVEALRRTDTEPNDQGSESDGAATVYGKLVAALQLNQPERRGCGTTTAVAALALATAWPDDPARGAMLAANMLGTDTDTIATMAAAISGATGNASPPPSVLDEGYLTAEARRLATLAEGGRVPAFSYPDLLHWNPPRSQLDAVGLADDRPALAGLGGLRDLPQSDPITHRRSMWRWTQADFGATFLVKRRVELRPLPSGNYPQRRAQTVASPGPQHTSHRGVRSEQLSFGETVGMTGQVAAAASPSAPAPDDVDRPQAGRRQRTPSSPHAGVDQVLAWLDGREFNDQDIGYAVRRFTETAGVDQLIAFVTALRYELRDRGRNASGTAAAEPDTRLELFQDTKGNYRFRLKSHSGEIIEVGESYTSTADALRQIGLITRNA